ncbi:MAG: enoyl-CoA hydratase [Gammaproteobacteria bacterium]|nr:enoyl-CoA hydratase [Gammaproteobacteria bacterium]MYE52882.1 enoyl-CoA hydratase [Gammaproteobacteria bacterium]
MEYSEIIVDRPRERVQRITLNNPEKRNPITNEMRTEIFHALEAADLDDSIRVTVIRGAGKCFSSGYNLKAGVQGANEQNQPFYTAGGLGNWARHLVEGGFKMWDMAKPIIAQVHGYCIAGATELALACDLVYVADDATIGYPIVRNGTPPNVQFYPWLMGMRDAMEMMLTGDSISGAEAAQTQFANRAYPADDLEDAVLNMAERVAKVPSDVQQFNKRAVHAQMEEMGIRSGLRKGTELHTLARFTETCVAMQEAVRADFGGALAKRDAAFGDYEKKSKD